MEHPPVVFSIDANEHYPWLVMKDEGITRSKLPRNDQYAIDTQGAASRDVGMVRQPTNGMIERLSGAKSSAALVSPVIGWHTPTECPDQ